MLGGTESGAWHLLTPSLVPFRGVPYQKIMEEVEVMQHVPTAGEQIVVCQCHRSCRYVEVASLCGVLLQVQFLDKMPVASNARCLELSVQKTAASDSVHRQSSWTFQCAQRQGAFSGGSVAMLGWAFFALLRVVPELSASFRSPR